MRIATIFLALVAGCAPAVTWHPTRPLFLPEGCVIQAPAGEQIKTKDENGRTIEVPTIRTGAPTMILPKGRLPMMSDHLPA